MKTNRQQTDFPPETNGYWKQFLGREPATDEAVQALLAPAHFHDEHTAYRCLRRIAPDAARRATLLRFLPQLLAALGNTQQPEGVLYTFEHFIATAPEPLSVLHFLASQPRVVENMVTLFAASRFLTQILLQNPQQLPNLVDQSWLTQEKSAAQIAAAAQNAMKNVALPAERADALRHFQRLELLRIGAADLLDFWDLTTVTRQLSHLADGVVQAALKITAAESQTDPAGFTVIALGKLGGAELNYSSDIDLLFLTNRDSQRYTRLSEQLVSVLDSVTGEGFLYRVDMRLRPWGRSGPLVTTVAGYLAYLQQNAQLWEKQALLKARVIAGNKMIGRDTLRRSEALIFALPSDAVRTNVLQMKQRIEAKLRRQGRVWGEVKRGRGSIRDIEFVTQYLQLRYGNLYADLRVGNTLMALSRLRAHDLLAPEEYRILTTGYTFLRTIEHFLQLMDYRQTHALPDDVAGMASLARRLRFQGKDAGRQLLNRYEDTSAAIRAVYQRHIGGNGMPTIMDNKQQPAQPRRSPVVHMDTPYYETFTPAEIQFHNRLAERLNAQNLAEVNVSPRENGRWRVTIVGYDYFGELSLICGLMVAHGLNILAGDVFTSEPTPPAPTGHASSRPQNRRPQRTPIPRTIVDVFLVKPLSSQRSSESWTQYTADLKKLLRLLAAGQSREAQGKLAQRVAASLPRQGEATPTLYPVDIAIDNETSPRYTILQIDAPDTVGFLYEISNALALNNVYIARVLVGSRGERVQDTLYITDARRQKITAPAKQQELRAAIVLVKHFTHLLPHAPDPESALLHFREFLGHLFRQPDWPQELTSLQQPKVLQALARLLGVSTFLWDDFLRMQYTTLFPLLTHQEALQKRKSKAQLHSELEAALQAVPDFSSRQKMLNQFKDREMFRIDMRYILGMTGAYWRFSTELTDLAEVVIEATYQMVRRELVTRYGEPLTEAGRPVPLSICALGKFGGRELGFASDIELIFVYNGNDMSMTSGPQVIAVSEFYERLVQSILQSVHSKQKGIFEIDLRLRPYGRAGSLAVALAAFQRYFAPDGAAWPYERQALVRLRPVAGDATLGQRIITTRDAMLYNGEPFNLAAMRAMRERQLRHLVRAGTVNAKYTPGGLVDVEYLVQGLQIDHGREEANLRVTNTRAAMVVLATMGILSPEDFSQLSVAHTFLRRLIEALRIVRGNAQDLTVPPVGSEAFAFLARRLNFSDPAQLQTEITRQMDVVQSLCERLLPQ